MNGTYKLTEDFEVVPYSGKFVRDINLTPADQRLPDVAICRVFSSRDDAVLLLSALQGGAAPGAALGSLKSAAKTAAARENAKKPRPGAQGKPKPRKPKTE